MSLTNPGTGNACLASYSPTPPSKDSPKKSDIPVKKNDFRHSLTNVRIYFILCFLFLMTDTLRHSNDCLTFNFLPYACYKTDRRRNIYGDGEKT